MYTRRTSHALKGKYTELLITRPLGYHTFRDLIDFVNSHLEDKLEHYHAWYIECFSTNSGHTISKTISSRKAFDIESNFEMNYGENWNSSNLLYSVRVIESQQKQNLKAGHHNVGSEECDVLKKQSLIKVQNTDNSCFWRCLALNIFENNDAIFSIIKKGCERDGFKRKNAREKVKAICEGMGYTFNMPIDFDSVVMLLID